MMKEAAVRGSIGSRAAVASLVVGMTAIAAGAVVLIGWVCDWNVPRPSSRVWPR